MPREVSQIHLTSRFRKNFRKLSPDLRGLAAKKDQIFRRNPFDPSLETHKLKGKLSDYWSYSVNRDIRVLFRFADGDVIYYDIGPHDIYS